MAILLVQEEILLVQRKRQTEHFQAVLNRPSPRQILEISNEDLPLEIHIDLRDTMREEVRKATSKLNNGKAPGEDNITGNA